MKLSPPKPLPVPEFVALMAVTIAVTALAIDAMLPALPAIAADLGAANGNDAQFIITVMFGGFSVGQIIFGPLSDSIGRKRALYLGAMVFAIGCVLSITATDMGAMLVGRALQGLGSAAARVVTLALVRDRYSGDQMAQIMAMIMAVFVIIPALAPAIGQAIMLMVHWRAVFGLLLLQCFVAVTWLALRQPETLSPEHKRPFSVREIGRGALEVARNRTAMGYTITNGLVFGNMVGYLTAAPQMFQDIYAVGTMFPVYFGSLAITIGIASAINSRLVARFGARKPSRHALLGLALLGCLYSAFALSQSGHPPLWTFMAFLLAAFFCIGILFGNLNALAMEPLGHIAGIGSAVVGSASTFIALGLGVAIGQLYSGTVMPLTVGFAVLGSAGFALVTWLERAPAQPA